MKIPVTRFGNDSGSAVMIVISLLGLLLTLSMGNTIVLNQLDRELWMVEQKQLHRYSGSTNHVQEKSP